MFREKDDARVPRVEPEGESESVPVNGVNGSFPSTTTPCKRGMRSADTNRQLTWTPVTIDTSSTRWSFDVESFVTFECDLLFVGHLFHVRAIVVHPHVTDQKNASICQDSGERAVN